jgi:hypothetical protein
MLIEVINSGIINIGSDSGGIRAAPVCGLGFGRTKQLCDHKNTIYHRG